jgi:hypothetical protein
VNRARQFLGKQRVDLALPVQSGFSFEGRGDDLHAKV